MRKRNNTDQNAHLPARTKTRRSTRSPRRRLLVLAQRRLQLEPTRYVARLSEIGIRVDFVGDTSRPVGQVFGLRLAPVVAAGGIGRDGAFAAAGGHFLDESGVRDGDGAHEVGLGFVDVAEVGNVGGGADGVGDAADWRGELVG
jgi:hypothetical protein